MMQGTTISVAPGGDVQAAINSLANGGTVVLQAGATYPRFDLNKSGVSVISSRASELSGPVSPGDARLAKVQSSVPAEPVIRVAMNVDNWKLDGLEVSTSSDAVVVYDLIRVGESRQLQTTVDQVPNNGLIDHCYVHGYTEQVNQRGISANGANLTIQNSYVADIHHDGSDSQAIGLWNTPGPVHIINNFLSAAGEVIMVGGADSANGSLAPANIEIRRNNLFKPQTWKSKTPSGKWWVVKNDLEFKSVKGAVVDGNVIEGNWGGTRIDGSQWGQDGTAILFTVRNQECTANWSTVQNVTFTNNTVKNIDGAVFNFLGKDNEAEPTYGKCPAGSTSTRGGNVTISNSLAAEGIRGAFLGNINGFPNIAISNTTSLQNGNLTSFAGEQSPSFKYVNSVTQDHQYGIFGDGGTIGNAALDKYAPGWTVSGNVIANPYSKDAGVPYPAGNDYPATLTLPADFRSPFPGKGADIDQLNAAQSGAVVSLPTPSPTPIASPSPSPVPTATPIPTPTPTPTPSPSPSPTPLTADWPWPSKYADQVKLREQVRQNGWRSCQVWNSRYWCERN